MTDTIARVIERFVERVALLIIFISSVLIALSAVFASASNNVSQSNRCAAEGMTAVKLDGAVLCAKREHLIVPKGDK